MIQEEEKIITQNRMKRYRETTLRDEILEEDELSCFSSGVTVIFLLFVCLLSCLCVLFCLLILI